MNRLKLLIFILLCSEYSFGQSASTLEFWSYLGGGQGDSIASIAYDQSGRIYVAGWTDSMNLPADGYQTERAGGKDVFIARLSADGKTLDFLTYLGGTGDEQPNHLSVDSSGNCWVTGFTDSRDFPLEDALQDEHGGGGSDAFIVKLSSNGRSLLYSTYLGGGQEDEGTRVLAEDPVLVAGRTRSTDFPIRESLQDEIAGRSDTFVTKLNTDGSAIEFSTYMGGERDDYLYCALTDPSGKIVLAGNTSSKEYPLESPIQEELKGSTDLFLTVIDAGLERIDFSTYLGGRSAETPYAILLDYGGRIVLAGDTSSRDFPLLQPIQPVLGGSSDIFVTVLKEDRTGLDASTFLGGSGFDSIRGMGLDEEHNLVFAGVTTSTDFPERGGLADRRENAEIVLGTLDPDQGRLIAATYLGGNRVDLPVDAFYFEGTFYTAGVTDSTDLPTEHALQPETGGKGVYRSNAGTDQWTPSGNGIADPNIDSLHVLREGGKTLVFAGTSSSGVFRSNDGGDSWTAIGPEETQVLSIAVDPEDTEVIYIGTNSTVMKTENGGEDWEAINEGLPGASFAVLEMDPSDSRVLYAGNNGRGVFKTENGGERWQAKNSAGLNDPAAKQIFSLAVHPSDSSVVYLGTNGTVYESSNGGSTWSPTIFTQVGPVRAIAIDPVNPEVVYASGFNQAVGDIVGKTEKDGQGNIIWRALPIGGSVADLSIDPQNHTTVYAATFEDGVFKSRDQGASWQQINSGLGTSKVTSIAVDPRIMSRVFAATQSGSDGFLLAFKRPEVFYFPQVADGAFGRDQYQTTLMLLNTGSRSDVRIDFFDSAGAPMEVALGDRPAASRHEWTLEKGQALVAETPGDGELKVGYAQVTAGGGVDGTLIFKRTDRYSKLVLFEAGVPMTQAAGDMVFLLDSLEEKDTGLVLVHPLEGIADRPDPAEVVLTLYDEDTNLIDDTTLNLLPGEHDARFIAEMFDKIPEQASEMRGFITIDTDFPLLALILRQRDKPGLFYPNDVPTLAPFPVLTPHNGSSTIYFPQVGDGRFGDEKFQTTFILANSGSGFGFAKIEFFDSAGEPMALDLGSGVEETSRSLFLSPLQFEFLQTTGEGEGKVGYARVSSNNLAVGGTAVFTQVNIEREMIMTEAGVPATIPAEKFSLFLDSLGLQDTGLAMVNTSGEEEANLEIRLFNLDAELVAETTMTLPAGGHLPRFIRELFSDHNIREKAANMQGVVTIVSNQPIAAVTMRQRDDPDRVFPAEIPTLTTFPVIRGIPE